MRTKSEEAKLTVKLSSCLARSNNLQRRYGDSAAVIRLGVDWSVKLWKWYFIRIEGIRRVKFIHSSATFTADIVVQNGSPVDW
jgi:hypothetical protein